MKEKMLSAAAALVVSIALAGPAMANGEVFLSQSKAVSGGVTPGDKAGFPITISLPGVYEFSGNIQPTANKIGIQITSSDVTIDFHGFRLFGAQSASFGVFGGGSVSGVTLRNGTIRAFKLDGINSTGSTWIIENMRITGNQRTGISCRTLCQISDNIISSNGGEGIFMLNGTVLNNTIFNNGGVGLYGGGFTGYSNNTFEGNVGGQVRGGATSLTPNACNPSPCP